VFDDRIFFSGRLFSYYATHPLGLDLRLPAYFSLTITEVLWGGITAQRVVSLVLHVGCALALYRLLLDLQHAALGLQAEADAVLRAAIGALAFALHPVAVYGAAYLVQRSIVLATLFSLVSAVLFLRGLRRGSHGGCDGTGDDDAAGDGLHERSFHRGYPVGSDGVRGSGHATLPRGFPLVHLALHHPAAGSGYRFAGAARIRGRPACAGLPASGVE